MIETVFCIRALATENATVEAIATISVVGSEFCVSGDALGFWDGFRVDIAVGGGVDLLMVVLGLYEPKVAGSSPARPTTNVFRF